MKFFRILSVICLVGMMFFLQDALLPADTNDVFLQTDWSSGSSVTNAAHPANKTGWTAYSSKDAYLSTATPGKLTEAVQFLSTVDTSNADFSAGTRAGVDLSGAGNAASLSLQGTQDDPFIDNLGRWTNNPEMPSLNWWSPYVKAGNYVYSLWKYKYFGRFDIATETWSFIKDFPGVIGYGAALTYPGAGDYIYATRGGATKQFFKYSISTDTWTQLADVPTGIGYGGSIASDGGDKIYCVVGGGLRKFYQYTVSTNTWLLKTDVLNWAVGRGASLVYPGSGAYLYLSHGQNTQFTRYLMSTDTWLQPAQSPQSISDLCYPGTGDYMYGWYEDAWNVTTMTRFSISGQVWEDLTTTSSVPLYPYRGLFYWPGAGTTLKWVSMGNYVKAFNFDPVSKKWDEPQGINKMYGWDNLNGRSVWDGGANIYSTRANGTTDFAQFSIANNAWAQKTGSPWGAYNGHAMVWLGSYLYSQQGWTNTGFARYNPVGNVWAAMAATPATVGDGGALATNGTYIYGLRGNTTVTFWRYDVGANSWNDGAVSDPVATVAAGGALVYPYAPGGGDYIFASRGNSTNTFWKYRISTDTWSAVAGAPYYFTNKATLTWPGSGNLVYAFFGHDYCFASYNIVTDTWTILPPSTRWQDLYFNAAAAGDKIYSVRNDYTMNTYTVSTGAWDELNSYNTTSLNYGSAVYPGGDTVYMIYGDLTSSFWKYSLSLRKWTGLVKAPSGVLFGLGTKAVYPGAGNYIYVVEGRGSKRFWRYDYVNNVWAAMADATLAFYSGSQIDGVGDVFYAAQGLDLTNPTYQASTAFFKYTISTNTWSALAVLPVAINWSYERGNNFVHIPSQGRLYWKRGEATSNFYTYNIAGDSWTALTSGVNGYNGQSLYYPGSGDLIYHLTYPGLFYKYSISGNAWTQMKNQSRLLGYTGNGDGDMFQVDQTLYAHDGTMNYLARYSYAADDWDTPVMFPSNLPMQLYGVFGYGSDGNLLYAGGSNGFWSYSISGRAWTALRAPSSDVGWNWDEWFPSMTYAGTGDYIYTTRGRNRTDFARYAITQNKWYALAAPPANFGLGHKLAATTSKVYCLRGDSTRNFWAYNATTNLWASMADLPGTVNYGSSLCYPGKGDLIYATRGDGSSDFYKYTISTNTWSQLASPPLLLMASDVNGASLIYPGRGDYLYFLPTSNYANWAPMAYFFRYSISLNTWEEASPGNVDFMGDAKLVYPGKGDYLYATRGGNNNYWDIVKFRIFKQGQYTSPVKNVGRNQSYDAVTWTDNAKGVIEFKAQTSTDPQMSSPLAWDSIAVSSKSDNLSLTYPAVKSNDQYLKYTLNLVADDLTKLPSIDDLTIAYNRYPTRQELTSSAYNSGEARNRLMKLSWANTVYPGTDIRFQMRTAPDNGGVPGAWTPWLGPGGTQTLNDTFTNSSDYAYDPNVEVITDLARLKKVLSTYTYTQRIFLDNTAIAIAYTNVVQTIELTSANNHFWAHVKADGSDVRFLDTAGNLLSYNMTTSGASFDYANKYAKIYVKILSLPASQKTSIYLKYGNAGAVSASDGSVVGVPGFSNLMAYYRFDEGSGTTIADLSGHGNTGTLQNSPTWVAGKTGTALSFNGTNQSVDLGSSATLKMTLPITVSYWVNFPAGIDGNWRVPVANTTWGGNPGYNLMINSNQQFIMTVNSSEATSPRNNWGVPTLTWHMITHTVNSSTSKLYIDGALKQTFNGSWTLSGSASNAWLGCSPTGGYNCFWGAMDEAAIWNRDLTDTEVSQLYQGSGGSAAPYYFSAVEDGTSSASLSGWNYRNTVEIDNTSGPELTNYQIKVTMSPSYDGFWSRCRSDGADVRFVDADNTTILNYYTASFDYTNKAATFWVKVPKILAGETKNIYLYYGRSDAAAVSSINSTMVKDFGEKGQANTSGLALDGAAAKASIASSAALSPAQALTIEADVKYSIDYWPAGWAKRKKVAIDNTGGTAQTNALVQFDIPFAAEMKADYSDLRFWETDHSRKLRYQVVSSDVTKITVLVEVLTLPAGLKSFYVYYGNAAASGETCVVGGLYNDTFTAPVVTNYTYGRTFFEAGAVRILGSNDWTSAFITENAPFSRNAQGTTFEASFKQSTVEATMIGWKNTGAGTSYTDMTYALYFDNDRSINIYEDGAARGQVTTNYNINNWYDIKITLDPTQGAKYYYRLTGAPAWTLLYTSAYSNAASFKPHITNHGYGANNAYTDNWKVYYGASLPTGTVFSPVFDPAVSAPAGTAWLPGFSYRKKVTIDNTLGSESINKAFTFDVAAINGKMRADYGDVRFVDTDGKSLSCRISSSDASKARFIVKIPALPASLNKDVFIYYGNASASLFLDSSLSAISLITPVFGVEEAAAAGIDQTIAVKSGAYGLKFTDSGLTAILNGTSLATANYDSGRFMHAAMTYDGAVLKLFVNGVQKASAVLTGAINTNGNSLVIGQGMSGVVDETRIWNSARLAGSICEDQYKYLDGTELGLVSYFRFNEAAGTTAVDSSIYGNNAVLSNNAAWAINPFSYTKGKPSALYHMDEGSGSTTADSSIYNNVLTLSNATWMNVDLTGFTNAKSLNFNGTTSSGVAPANSGQDVTGRISLEAWIKPLSIIGNHTIIAKGNDAASRWNYELIQIADSVAFQFSSGITKQHLVTPAFLLAGNLYYIAVTFDEDTDTVKIYSNGVLLYTNAAETSALLVNTDPLYIGREASGATSFSGAIDEVRLYKRILTDKEVLTHYEQRLLAQTDPGVYDVYEPVASADVGAYVTSNPVIQPVMAAFYTSKNMVQFQEISNKPFGTEIKYQVSPNGYTWHWWDGVQWSLVTGGYTQTNTAAEINSNLVAFQNIYPDGDFYYRAYLHSDPSSFKTPSLDNIGVTLLTGDTYYVNADGSTGINPLHTDADNDQWFQYKAIFYSEGQDTAFLDDVSTDYIKSFIQVTSPNGGNVLTVGSSTQITWTAQAIQSPGGSGQVKIEYSIDGGSTYQLIADNLANTGSYNWTIPDTPSQQALIRISSKDIAVVTDVSDAPFRILSLLVTSPNGAEKWEAGKMHNITWDVTGNIPNNIIKIEYSPDGGTSWQTVAASVPNTGTFPWTVPGVYSDTVLVRLSSPSNSHITDISNAAFSILPSPAFNISSPTGTDQLSIGGSASIAWRTNSLLFSGQVILEYSTDDFQADIQNIATIAVGAPQGANNNDDILGSYNWTVPDLVSSSVKVRVREAAIPAGRDTQQEISATSQAFRIVEPKLLISAPTTGDIWVAADTENITWTTQGSASNDLKLEYTVDGSIYSLIGDNQANSGSYAWNIPPGAEGNAVSARITDNQRPQVYANSQPFKVLAHATAETIAPNGGETLTMGTNYQVRWRTYGRKLALGGADYNKISVFYSIDNGANWALAAFNLPNTGSYQWLVPDFATAQGLIKVVDQNDASAAGISAAPFSIVDPTITLTSPVGGESWYATGNYSITWTSAGSASNNLKLEYSTNGGTSWNVIATGRANSGNYLWGPIADVNSSQMRIRITDATRPAVTTTSPANFTITPPTITMISPNGSEAWAVGTTQNIRWTSAGEANGAIRDNLTIQLSTNSGGSWATIATGEANNGLYQWVVSDNVSATCRIKAFDATRVATADTSNADFAIALPMVTITSPNGGEEWPIGALKEVTWSSVGSVSNNLKLEYSKDNFTTATTIATGLVNSGTYNWTVPDDASAVVKLRLTDASRPAVTDQSDSAFSIVNPILTITYPNGGELLSVGDVENITWQNVGTVSNSLKIEYSKDSFVTSTVIAANAPNFGTFAWTVPNDVSTSMKIRITDNGRPVVWDKSDANFTILPTPAITVTVPVLNDIWRVGTVHNITWTDNGGRISNNLTLQYSTDGGTTWKLITSGRANNGTYAWTIPDDVSATAMVKVFDANRTATTSNSALFNLANPRLTLTSPNGGEVWSVGDPGPVRWTSEGTISENLVLEYSPDAGATWYFVRGGIPNSGSFSWTVPDYVTVQCLLRIKDGNRPAVFDVSDAVFTISPMPTISFTAPVGGQTFVLGQTVPITWTWTGLSIANMTLDYSNDNFMTRRIIATNLANTGSYTWTIPADALIGQTIQLRLTDGTRTQISAKSSGYLRIRGGFTITSPNGGEQWVAKSGQTITWQTLGTIASVKLEYTIDGSNWVFIASPANSGSYTWTLPDVKSSTVKIRVSDPDDDSTFDVSDANFSIVYATVVFKVMDYDSLQHLADFAVSEPASGWSDSGLSSPVTRTAMYPYGAYTTFFTKLTYIDNSVSWNPPKQGTSPYYVTVYLENSANAQVSWEAILTYSFSPANDSLTAVGSLQRKGKLIGTTDNERADLGVATLTIYQPDGQTVRNALVATTPSTTGMYNFTLTDTKFEGGKIYPATLTIEYRARPYISSANIDVGSEILQYEFFTQTATQLAESVSNIEQMVASTAEEMKTEVKGAITDTKTEIKTDTAKILTATENTLPAAVEAMRTLVEDVKTSAILNTENTVKQGGTLVVRYRTFTGLAPTIDVYNAKNVQEVTAQRMAEVGTTGIYEYSVQFNQNWGKGEFTIVCSEATRGALDAMTITVQTTDIEQVYNQISSVVGATANLSNMNNIVTNLGTQFAAIEGVLNRTGQDIVSGVKNSMGNMTTLSTLFSQLKSVSKQIQVMSGDKGISLEKLYNVSEDRQQDMTYLKNKTQELKAAMELSKKLIENMANKPVVQTWYEYKQ